MRAVFRLLRKFSACIWLLGEFTVIITSGLLHANILSPKHWFQVAAVTPLPFIKRCHHALENLYLIEFCSCPLSLSVTAEVLSATALDFCETKGKCWELCSTVGMIRTLCMNYNIKRALQNEASKYFRCMIVFWLLNPRFSWFRVF